MAGELSLVNLHLSNETSIDVNGDRQHKEQEETYPKEEDSDQDMKTKFQKDKRRTQDLFAPSHRIILFQYVDCIPFFTHHDDFFHAI